MVESDFLSAEFSLVPAFKARDIGFDRALIGAYGHDDRVCSYPALTAICEDTNDSLTSMVVLADKEEIGSEGNTGMQCGIYADLIDAIAFAFGKPSALVRMNSKCLSADVTAAYDPNFAGVYEKRNSGMSSCGTAICKFIEVRFVFPADYIIYIIIRELYNLIYILDYNMGLPIWQPRL